MRILGRIRLSRSTEASTSPQRQRHIIEGWAQLHGHQIIGWAEDIDVSGSVSPFDAPQFGHWLNTRRDEYDTVVAWKLDRLARNTVEMWSLFKWAIDNDKTIVSVSESIDLSTPIGKAIAGFLAAMAEMELQAIKERVKSSRAHLRTVGRWAGGTPCFGYRKVKHPAGAGWALAVDDEQAATINRIAGLVADGTPITRVCTILNDEGIPGPRGGNWQHSPLRVMLGNPALRGYSTHQGNIIKDVSGQPVRIAEPVIDDDLWFRVQDRLKAVADGYVKSHTSRETALAGICTCITCGQPMDAHTARHNQNGRQYVYERLRCRGRKCKLVKVSDVHAVLEDVFEVQAPLPVVKRVWRPGCDNSTELRSLHEAMAEIQSVLDTAKSVHARKAFADQLVALDARIAQLEEQPMVEAGWVEVATGQTYGEVWAAADWGARGELLREIGFTIKVGMIDGRLGFQVDWTP